VKQHIGRQVGVQKVDVNLIDGKVDVTPKEDGQIDPAQLLKATYDSGVSTAEMDITASGRIVSSGSDALVLQTSPSQSFTLSPNDLSKDLGSLAGTTTFVTVKGLLYKKPPGKKKSDLPTSLNLSITEVLKKE